MNLALLRWRAFSVDTGLANTPTQLTRSGTVSIAADGTATTVSVTWATHRLRVGDLFVISGCTTQPLLNGVWQVAVVSNANAFTFATRRGEICPASGSPFSATLTVAIQAQRAILISPLANTGNLGIGPDANADTDVIPVAAAGATVGNAYLVEMPVGAKCDLSEWYVQSTVAHQTLRVLYV
jgi:hypothetical protein